MAELEDFSVERHQKLFRSGSRVEAKLQLRFENFELSAFLSAFLPKLFELLGSKEQVLNLKGRDKAQSASSEDESSKAAKDELLLLSGAILREPNKGFLFSIHSPFDSFPSHSAISHALECKQNPKLPHPIPWSSYGKLAPLKPESFRFGLQEFRAVFGAPLIGVTPTVSDELLIDANEQTLSLRAYGERMKKADKLPMRKTGILEEALRILSSLSGRDLLYQMH